MSSILLVIGVLLAQAALPASHPQNVNWPNAAITALGIVGVYLNQRKENHETRRRLKVTVCRNREMIKKLVHSQDVANDAMARLAATQRELMDNLSINSTVVDGFLQLKPDEFAEMILKIPRRKPDSAGAPKNL